MKQYIKLISTLFCSLFALTACENYDFDTDDSYNKLFRTPKITIEELDATFIDLSWSKVPNADYYLLELSKDEFASDIQPYGTDKSIHTNAYKIEKLLGGTEYSLRIKAVSDKGIPESEYSTLTFKTKSEQILNEVAAITGSSALISWEPGLEVNKITLVKGEETGTSRALTDEEIAAGEVNLTGLSASTSYTVLISLNDVVRGKRTFNTTENFPEGYTVVNLKADDGFKDILANQTGRVVLVLPIGSEFKLKGETADPDHLIPAQITSIIFWGATGGTEKVKFSPKGIAATGTLDELKFYNLDLYNGGSGGDYIINQNLEANIQTLSIENCIVRDTRGVVRVQSSGLSSNIDHIEFTNNIFTNIGSYGLASIKGMTGAIEDITVQSSTVNGLGGALIDTNMPTLKVNINKCTFNNYTGGKVFINTNKIVIAERSISNSVFGLANTIKGDKLSPFDINQVYYSTDCVWGDSNKIGTAYDKSSADIFEDPDNGNFKIKDPSFPAGVGDPRWAE